MEQVLGKIKDEHGKSALRDGQSLLGLFVDYSHNQLRPQANALRTFLDCKGNQRILNLCSEPSQKQQTEYHRLIQEMVRDYNMQEATAADVCAAFWRVAIGTEPPISGGESTRSISEDGLKEERKMRHADSHEENGGQAVKRADGTAWIQNVLMGDKADTTSDEQRKKATVLGTEILRSQIQCITFLDTLSSAPAASWDVSQAKNGSVRAWVDKKGELFDLFIAGEGGVNGRFCDSLFACYTKLREIHFNGNFHTDHATSFREMFYFCHSLTELDVSGFNTSMVTDMRGMFQACQHLKTLNVSGFDTSRVTDMMFMFFWCYILEVLDVSRFDTSKVKNMRGMFGFCPRLKALDVGGFDTSQVINMSRMFEHCESLKTLDVSGFDTSKVTDMSDMFYWCNSLEALDVSGFDTSKVISSDGFMDSWKLVNGRPWRELFH